jgi:Tol biopolymer transport system component
MPSPSLLVVVRCTLDLEVDLRWKFELWRARLEMTSADPALSLDKLLFETYQPIAAPRLSPDGTKVVFNMQMDEGPRDIFVIQTDGSNSGPVNLTQHPQNDVQASWFLGSEQIIFYSTRGSGSHIFTMDINTGSVDQIFDDETCSGTNLIRLPEDRITFKTRLDDTNEDGLVDDDDTAEIYATPLETCKPQRLSYSDSVKFYLQASPNGRYLAYVDALSHEPMQVGFSRIYLLDTRKGKEQLLYEHPSSEWSIEYLAWEPAGQHLLFAMRNLNAYESNLYLINTDGGEAKQIQAPEGFYNAADW